MAKTTKKTAAKKRTQVRDLPLPGKEMTNKESQKIRGGGVGPSCRRPKP